MGFKIKNSLTGEFEKLPILTLKGEKGETGGVEEYNKVDYMGNKYETLKQANDANVEYAVKTAIGEFNYLDYEGQHITATDTIAGQAKNAVVEGQTLVNLLDYSNSNSLDFTKQNNGHWSISVENNSKNLYLYNPLNQPLKDNTLYTIIVNITKNSLSKEVLLVNGYTTGVPVNVPLGYIGKLKLAFTTKSSGAAGWNQRLQTVVLSGATGEIELGDYILLEGDYTNVDIPYFEGMTSVKAPVLKSVGKNLLPLGEGQDMSSTRGVTFTQKDGKLLINGTATDTADYRVFNHNNNVEQMKKFNSLPVGTTLTMSNNLGKDCYFNVIRNGSSIYLTKTITIQDGDKDINAFVRINRGETYNNTELNIQIEQGSDVTSYEPYKSNILTVNEDVELRGIDDVKDTLNCLTGEVTNRIGEIVLDGSEIGWGTSGMSNQSETVVFQVNTNSNKTIPHPKPGSLPITSQLPSNNDSASDSEAFLKCQGTDGHGFYIRIKRSRLETEDVSGFKKWLNQNPITVQYQLETESIKTVDLSDNHVYSYKDVTHYDCSSAGGSLVPTLSVKVPTDVQATITQQRETIQILNSENERLNQIQEALKASMLDSQVQLMNLSWNTDFEVFTLRESIAPKDSLMDSRTGSNIGKFSQAKFIIENDCPDLEKLNSQIEYYFSKDVFSQEQFEELTDLISIVKGGNGCEY